VQAATITQTARRFLESIWRINFALQFYRSKVGQSCFGLWFGGFMASSLERTEGESNLFSAWRNGTSTSQAQHRRN
jgi:hypothetical protein